MRNYILNPSCDGIVVKNTVVKNSTILRAKDIARSLQWANEALNRIDSATKAFEINVFNTLGMRNLSGMVGEVFALSVRRNSAGKLTSNLHQDGYPDLLLVDTDERLDYYHSLYRLEGNKKYPFNKQDFSPFRYGGIEVKATCGSTPTATETTPKPLIGEQRIRIMNAFDWKAHHRDTNNLLAVLWDFIDEVPTLVACFFRNDLTEDDWGKIVKPQEGGGRTTSVSIMRSRGVSKMCQGWIAVIDDPLYTAKLAAKKWIGYDVKQ
jgi:hypothetical protein